MKDKRCLVETFALEKRVILKCLAVPMVAQDEGLPMR